MNGVDHARYFHPFRVRGYRCGRGYHRGYHLPELMIKMIFESLLSAASITCIFIDLFAVMMVATLNLKKLFYYKGSGVCLIMQCHA